MGTRYRLPDALGGGECTLIGQRRPDGLYGRVQVGEGDDAISIDLLRSLLTEVEPPLPPEPPFRAVVLDRERDCWQLGDGWSSPFSTAELSWLELNKNYGPLVVLVPDPLAEAPELPWVCETPTGSITINDRGDGRVQVAIVDQHDERATATITPSMALEAGLALLAAGDQAQTGPWVASSGPQAAARPRSCPTCHSPGMPRRDRGVLCPDTWHHAVAGWATTPEVAQPAN